MHRLRTVKVLRKELLTNANVDLKERISDEMIMDLLYAMKENKCFNLTEEYWHNENETKLEIEAFVLSPSEYGRIRQIISFLKVNSDPSLLEHIEDLESLLTKKF